MAEPWLASIFDGSRARPQVTFSLVFGVFAVIGYISFGAKMEAFSTITGSLHFIYKMAQGELDMEGLHDAGGILGLIYYYAFTMMVRPRARARPLIQPRFLTTHFVTVNTLTKVKNKQLKLEIYILSMVKSMI